MSVDPQKVRREFRELSLATQRLRQARDSDLHPSAVHPLNKNKNRYPDVLPVEETRIKLQPLGEIPASDYINANLVRSEHKFSAICSQAPLPHTFDDFWRMVWEQVRVPSSFSGGHLLLFFLHGWNARQRFPALFDIMWRFQLRVALHSYRILLFCLVGCSHYRHFDATPRARENKRASLLAHEQDKA